MKEYSGFQPLDPPPDGDWIPMWQGMYMLREAFSSNTASQHSELFSADPLDALVLEAFSFLAILEGYDGGHVNVVELGAGRAPWCLMVASVVRHQRLASNPSSYFAVALEAEPTHFQWARTHLEKQGVSGVAVHGAIGSRSGSVRFLSQGDPAASMGQAVHERGNLEVPMWSLDELCERNEVNEIGILHMDVQGAEVDAVVGAEGLLARGRIDHLVIGTHSPEIERELKEKLADTHQLLLELPIRTTKRFPSLSREVQSKDDGLQVWGARRLYHRDRSPNGGAGG